MMKKILTLVMISMIFGGAITFAITTYFSDVSENSRYYNAVNNLSSKGIITGYPDGTFKPNNTISRAEVAVMMDRLLQYIEGESLTMTEAKQIAESSSVCTQEGTLKNNDGYYNENSQTRRFDMDISKQGCAPACVVSSINKTAEMNRRCTGLLQ